MLGYWDDPEQTAEAIDAAGWMHTGDLAVMDDDGYVNIVGRIKDMVIRGGENVYPREIEEFLYAHPDIADVAGRSACPTSGTARSSWPGSQLRAGADARPRRTSAASAAARSPTTRSRATCTFVDEFPMTVTGKIAEVKMREVTIAELGLAGRSRRRRRKRFRPSAAVVRAGAAAQLP